MQIPPIILASGLTHQLTETAYLSILISGWGIGTGVITVEGTVAGGSEIFSFSRDSTLIGKKEFSKIDKITPAGFMPTTGTIEIKAVTQTNQPILQEIEIFAAMNCWVDLRRGGVNIILPGGVVQTVSKLFCLHDESKPLYANDIIYYNNVRYKVEFVEFVDSRSSTPHHLELILERLKAS